MSLANKIGCYVCALDFKTFCSCKDQCVRDGKNFLDQF